MAAVLEIVLRGRDEFSGAAGKAQVSLGGLLKTGAALGLGFHGVEGAMAGVKNVMIKSVGEALKYEHQMAQIRALTGATKEDTDLLDKSIIDLTKAMPKSPAELGAGAYFILSSGISDAAEAAEVLEIAAKASTVGLGETEVVADALTTVLNAYQLEARDAGRVTDILMQAVKDGKAEADAFSGVLGRVVPIAAQMGVSFEEVAANLATFTRLGVSAEEAATGLRGVMTQLLKPSQEAEETLAGVGLSMAQVREEVREKGLLAVLTDLMERFKGNDEAIAKLFPDVRGLTNVLATAGVQNDTYVETLGNMETATGNLDKGFQEVSNTTEFKVQKAMNDLNVALMQLGTEILPLVAAGAIAMSNALEEVRRVAGVLRGDFSGLDNVALDLGKGLLDVGQSLLDQSPGYRLVTGLLGGAKEEFGLTAEEVREFDKVMLKAAKAPVLLAIEETKAAAATKALGDMAGKASQLFKDWQSVMREGITGVLPTAEEFGALESSMRANADAAAEWAKSQEQLNDAQERFAERIGEMGADLSELQGELEAALKIDPAVPIHELERLRKQLEATDDPVEKWRIQQQIEDVQEQLDKVDPDNIERLTDRIDEMKKSMAEAEAEHAQDMAKMEADAQKSIPPIVSGFDQWKERIGDLAKDYEEFEPNLKTILDTLLGHHVRNAGEIVAVVRQQGPEFTANFAQWFLNNPTEAARTLEAVMPGIMREAGRKAIENVIAEVGRFNEVWQKDVIGALNALPEEKRFEIIDTTPPEFWLHLAQLLATPGELEIAARFGTMSSVGFQRGGFVPAGVTVPAVLHGPEVVVPLSRAPRLAGGGVTVQVTAGFLGRPGRRELWEMGRDLADEIERRRRLGF